MQYSPASGKLAFAALTSLYMPTTSITLILHSSATSNGTALAG